MLIQTSPGGAAAVPYHSTIEEYFTPEKEAALSTGAQIAP
jgi:hypothetical protein